MAYQTVFQRHEIKYLITREQQQRIREAIAPYMQADAYGRSTIRNVYFDTPTHQLIRRSLEKPIYKEKLRVRSYATARADSTVFVELKKKYKGVVYKRRVAMPEAEAMAFLRCEKTWRDTQITRELRYFLEFYAPLVPMIFLSYEREAFYAQDDPTLRLTFDENILWRQERLSLQEAPDGKRLLPEDTVLMEIKTATAIPLWLTAVLTREGIRRTPFSKYGTAYLSTVRREQEEEENSYVGYDFQRGF